MAPSADKGNLRWLPLYQEGAVHHSSMALN
jgi:hypothetical protein